MASEPVDISKPVVISKPCYVLHEVVDISEPGQSVQSKPSNVLTVMLLNGKWSTPVVMRKFDTKEDCMELMSHMEKLKGPFFRPIFVIPQDGSFGVVGPLEIGCSFYVWCCNIYDIFWKQSTSGGYSVISLGEIPKKVFTNILKGLKSYHDQNIGHGNLKNGITILENGEVSFCNETFAHFTHEGLHLEAICDDMLDVKYLLEYAVQVVEKMFRSHSKEPVTPPASLIKFIQLYDDFPEYTATVSNVSTFSFYVRNNPLFLDTTGDHQLAKKVIDLRDYNRSYFDNSVRKYVFNDLNNWTARVHHPLLLQILGYDNDKYKKLYSKWSGIHFFIRNSFGHGRKYDHSMDDGKMTELIQDNLPFVLPSLFLGMVQSLDVFPRACLPLCGCTLTDFLQKPPSNFS